jgi:preprotein translocase subunit YajC
MRRYFTVLTAAFAVVAFSSMVFAQAATQTVEKKKVVKTVVQTEKVVKASSVSGKVAKFDEATRILTVTTKGVDTDFTLAADAKIMAGAKAATTADLAGKTVKVTYTTVDGKNVASKVTIAPEPKAPAKTEKK